jgi:hypothetical protein
VAAGIGGDGSRQHAGERRQRAVEREFASASAVMAPIAAMTASATGRS